MFGGERVFCLSGFLAKMQALQMGLGCGWMPIYLVSPELKSGVLRELRFVGGSLPTIRRGDWTTAIAARASADSWPMNQGVGQVQHQPHGTALHSPGTARRRAGIVA